MTQPRRPSFAIAAIAALLVPPLLFASAGFAADPEPEAPAAAASLETAEALAAQVTEEIRAFEAELGERPATPEEAKRLEQLRVLQRTYTRQSEVLRSEQTLRKREEDAERRLASGPSGQLAKPPPYLLAVLDALADARDAQRERTKTVVAALEAAKQAHEAADKALEQAERERRKAAEAAEKAKDPTEAARLALVLRNAELFSRAAAAKRELADLEVDNLERKLTVQQRDVQLLEDTVQWVGSNLALDPESTQATRSRLEDRVFQAKRQSEEARREIEQAERRLAEAERRLEADPTSALREAEVEARRAQRRLWQRRAELADALLPRIDAQATLEERRLLVLSDSASRQELLEWQSQLEARRAETERTLRLLEVRRSELQSEITTLRQAEAAAQPGARRWIARRITAVEGLVKALAQDVASLTELETLDARVLVELSERTSTPSFRDRFDDLGRAIAAVWQFELFAAEDRPITFGKIATGLLLFVLGFLVARVSSGLLGRLLLRRTALERGAATAIQSLAFYVLLVLFFLFALRSVSIPLTAFTVLGGALAIGVGFGSQNIVNNFISGLILLAERPIKVGDVIEVDGEKGTVEWIGARSTRVRTFDNVHIIVPNSAFLEKNVVNWTLSDDDVRTRVDVGVAYGSPTRDVQRLLNRAISEHGKVLEQPEPLVLFSDFGNDALMFRCYFWLRSRNMGERLTIESDIRYRIDHLFREAGITIAFPQRDVHLDVEAPLPIRLVSEADSPDPRGDEKRPDSR